MNKVLLVVSLCVSSYSFASDRFAPDSAGSTPRSLASSSSEVSTRADSLGSLREQSLISCDEKVDSSTKKKLHHSPEYIAHREAMKNASLQARSSGKNALTTASAGFASMLTAVAFAYHGCPNQAMAAFTAGSTCLGLYGAAFMQYQQDCERFETVKF